MTLAGAGKEEEEESAVGLNRVILRPMPDMECLPEVGSYNQLQN